MHPDVGVCSIGYDELIAVLLLRQQREHAVQPAPGLWTGRNGTAEVPALGKRQRRRLDRVTGKAAHDRFRRSAATILVSAFGDI